MAVMEDDTLDLHGEVLKDYDGIVTALGASGVFLMYIDKDKSIDNKLPWTGLLEWIVGWAGLMGALIKLSADAAAGWK